MCDVSYVKVGAVLSSLCRTLLLLLLVAIVVKSILKSHTQRRFELFCNVLKKFEEPETADDFTLWGQLVAGHGSSSATTSPAATVECEVK